MTYRGPAFEKVETIEPDALDKAGGLRRRSRPLLVKGAVKRWPASERWSFEALSKLRYPDGSEPVVKFQNGLVEQGVTRKQPDLSVGPYLLELEKAAAQVSVQRDGLLPKAQERLIKPEETFHLDWSYMKSFVANKLYLAQWN